MAPFLLLVFVAFLGWSIYGLVRAKRSRAEALRIAQRMREARWTSIEDAPETGTIVISGKASAPEVVTAPFTGGEALWARARLQSNVGVVVIEWIQRVGEITVDDGSGRLARIDLGTANVRWADCSVGGSENADRIEQWLRSQLYTRSESASFEYESVIRPGDSVNVLGNVALPRAGYRDGGNVLRFSDEDEVLLFDAGTEPQTREMAGRLMGCAVFGIVFFSIATLITLLSMLSD